MVLGEPSLMNDLRIRNRHPADPPRLLLVGYINDIDGPKWNPGIQPDRSLPIALVRASVNHTLGIVHVSCFGIASGKNRLRRNTHIKHIKSAFARLSFAPPKPVGHAKPDSGFMVIV